MTEIRTPLNGIIGMIQYLLSTDVNNEQASSIETAHMSALSLLDTVNDIINLRQIEVGKLTIAHRDEPVGKLRLVLKELFEIFAFMSYEKGYQLRSFEPDG